MTPCHHDIKAMNHAGYVPGIWIFDKGFDMQLSFSGELIRRDG